MDERVVGFARAIPLENETAEITTIFVEPDHWGQGIGRQLLELVIHRLRAQGFSAITLWVLELNQRARRFYEAAGFYAAGDTKTSDSEGIMLEEVRYLKCL